MHILLTRPLEDSQALILSFQKLGHNVSHMPLIKIEKKNYENLDFSDFKGIIFTIQTQSNIHWNIFHRKYIKLKTKFTQCFF